MVTKEQRITSVPVPRQRRPSPEGVTSQVKSDCISKSMNVQRVFDATAVKGRHIVSTHQQSKGGVQNQVVSALEPKKMPENTKSPKQNCCVCQSPKPKLQHGSALQAYWCVCVCDFRASGALLGLLI